MALRTVVGKTFGPEDGIIDLDETLFCDCIFEGARAQYSGGEFVLNNCEMRSIYLMWTGAAERTLNLARSLGWKQPQIPMPVAAGLN